MAGLSFMTRRLCHDSDVSYVATQDNVASEVSGFMT